MLIQGAGKCCVGRTGRRSGRNGWRALHAHRPGHPCGRLGHAAVAGVARKLSEATDRRGRLRLVAAGYRAPHGRLSRRLERGSLRRSSYAAKNIALSLLNSFTRTASTARLVVEPARRDTAPALTLAASLACADGSDAILIVMPADHSIGDLAALQGALESRSALRRARSDRDAGRAAYASRHRLRLYPHRRRIGRRRSCDRRLRREACGRNRRAISSRPARTGGTAASSSCARACGSRRCSVCNPTCTRRANAHLPAASVDGAYVPSAAGGVSRRAAATRSTTR